MDVTFLQSLRFHPLSQVKKCSPINKKQDIIETNNNDTNIQYRVVQIKGS